VINPAKGKLAWLVDHEAAQKINKSIGATHTKHLTHGEK
jgi:hypothetical protein